MSAMTSLKKFIVKNRYWLLAGFIAVSFIAISIALFFLLPIILPIISGLTAAIFTYSQSIGLLTTLLNIIDLTLGAAILIAGVAYLANLSNKIRIKNMFDSIQSFVLKKFEVIKTFVLEKYNTFTKLLGLSTSQGSEIVRIEFNNNDTIEARSLQLAKQDSDQALAPAMKTPYINDQLVNSLINLFKELDAISIREEGWSKKVLAIYQRMIFENEQHFLVAFKVYGERFATFIIQSPEKVFNKSLMEAINNGLIKKPRIVFHPDLTKSPASNELAATVDSWLDQLSKNSELLETNQLLKDLIQVTIANAKLYTEILEYVTESNKDLTLRIDSLTKSIFESKMQMAASKALDKKLEGEWESLMKKDAEFQATKKETDKVFEEAKRFLDSMSLEIDIKPGM